MAINDPVVIQFVNDQVRPIADILGRTYYSTKKLRDYVAANPEILAALSAGRIEDTDSSGRKPVTADEVKTLLSIADALVADFEKNAGEKRSSVLRVAVNPGA